MEPSAEPHYAGYQFPGEPLHRDGTMTGSDSSAIDIQPADGARLSAADTAAIDAIFFASSNTQQFASDAARHAFRDRWLGRYLTADPRDLLFLARSDGTVVGYCLGAVENAATQPRFAGIAYFQAFAQLCARFPAHLHINLAPGWRGLGIGQRLIEAFAGAARAHGAPGLHVVTSQGARNVIFYERAGFTLQGSAGPPEAKLVFLARALS